MNVRSVINLYTSEKKAIGINIRLKDSSYAEFSYCILQQVKNQYIILHHKSGIAKWEDVLSEVLSQDNKEARIHIHIEGKGIFTKKTDKSQEINEEILSKLFPGFNSDSFVLQIFTSSDEKYISLLRKDALVYIKDIWTFSPFIQSASLGSLSLSQEDTENEAFKDKDETLYLSYKAAKLCFNPNDSFRLYGTHELETNKINYGKMKEAYLHGRYALIALLIVVSFNFLFFSFLDSKVTDLQSIVSNQKGSQERGQQEANSSGRAQLVFENIGWLSNRMPLYYADQIGASIPSSIFLTSLEVGTRDNGMWQKERKIRFQSSRIKIAGEAQSVAELAKWLEVLRSMSWVEQVEEQKYDHNSSKGRAGFEFVIIVGKALDEN